LNNFPFESQGSFYIHTHQLLICLGKCWKVVFLCNIFQLLSAIRNQDIFQLAFKILVWLT
jgi:hypothetical protein